jgi:hypothetical protein
MHAVEHAYDAVGLVVPVIECVDGCAYWYSELHKESSGSIGKWLYSHKATDGLFTQKYISNIHIEYVTADTFIFVDHFIWNKSIHYLF